MQSVNAPAAPADPFLTFDADDSGAQTHTIAIDLGDAYDMLCDAIAKLVTGFALRLEVA